ncbi:hypothetical protein FB451DRAFT_449202 [Mycena latifolia]|nr:hypothetical protein FB451DRAFT_449202 [Mycena latifolia]
MSRLSFLTRVLHLVMQPTPIFSGPVQPVTPTSAAPPPMTDYQIAAPSMYGPGGQDTLFDPIVFGFHLPPAESPRTSGITLILTCLFLMPLVPFHRTMPLTDSNSLNTISVLLTTAWTSI